MKGTSAARALCVSIVKKLKKMYSKNLSVIFWTHLPAGIFIIKIPKQAVFMKYKFN